MLQNLIIILDDTSLPFCCYENPMTQRRLMAIEILREGILFALKENLSVQVIYPDYQIPLEYEDELRKIDHLKISEHQSNKEAVCLIKWDTPFSDFISDGIYILRTNKDNLFKNYSQLVKIIAKVKKLNLIITDVESFTKKDFEQYQDILSDISSEVLELFNRGIVPNLNVLTDRLYLSAMNNCNAGEDSITLAPNGKFYICPAFYHNSEYSIGDTKSGLNILNSRLYQYKYAPICNKCDAFHCKHCIWLNYATTYEVNTPSHEQCYLSHVERNASMELLKSLKKLGVPLVQGITIDKIDYIDPFDKIKKL